MFANTNSKTIKGGSVFEKHQEMRNRGMRKRWRDDRIQINDIGAFQRAFADRR